MTAAVPQPRGLKRRGLRASMLRGTLASYGVDALLLGGFTLAGTVPGWIPLAYVGAGWLTSGILYVLCGRPSAFRTCFGSFVMARISAFAGRALP